MIKMPTVESALLVLIYSLISLNFSLCTQDGPCVPQNNCQCVFPSGAFVDLKNYPSNGTIIDLNSKTGSDPLKIVFTPCENALVFNPLFSSVANGCQNRTSVCIATGTSFIDGGRSEEMVFHSESEKKNVRAAFSKHGWNVTFVINCTNFEPSDNITVSSLDIKKNTVEVDLKIRKMCINFKPPAGEGYGVFSSLLMLILIGVSFYLIGGAILLKFLRGAEGVEMIPNYEFWQNFPQYCKNAFNACFSRFESATPYENV